MFDWEENISLEKEKLFYHFNLFSLIKGEKQFCQRRKTIARIGKHFSSQMKGWHMFLLIPCLLLSLLLPQTKSHVPFIIRSLPPFLLLLWKNWGPGLFTSSTTGFLIQIALTLSKNHGPQAKIFPFLTNSKKIKTCLKKWNISEFGIIDSKIANLEAKIQSLDNIANL